MAAPVRVGGGYIEVLPKLVGFDNLAASVQKKLNTASAQVGAEAGKVIGTEMAAKTASTFVAAMRSQQGTFRTLGATLGAQMASGFAASFSTSLAGLSGRLAASVQASSLAMASGMAGVSREMHKTERAMQKTAQESLRLQREQVSLTRAQVRAGETQDRVRISSNQLSTALARQRTMTQALARAQVEQQTSGTRLRSQVIGLQRELVRLAAAEERTAQSAHRLAAAQTTAASRLGAVRRSADATSRSMHSVAGSLSMAGSALIFYGTVPLAAAAGYAIKTGLAFTDLKNRTVDTMAEFLHGRKIAEAYVNEIARLSKKTPLAVEQMLDMARALSQTRFGAANLMPMMRGLINLIGAHHMSTQQAAKTQLAFVQMLQKGRIQSEEVTRQLANAGVQGWELFSAATGKSVRELQAQAKAGTLLTDDVFPKLIKYLNENRKYAGASGRAVSNLNGAWTALKNTFKVGLANDENSAGAKKLAASLNKLNRTIDQNMDSIQAFLTGVVDVLTKVVNGVSAMVAKFQALPPEVKRLITTMLAFALVLGPLFKIGASILHIGSGFRSLGRLMGGAEGQANKLSRALRGIGTAALFLTGLPTLKAVLGAGGRQLGRSRAGQFVGGKVDSAKGYGALGGVAAGAGLERLLARFPILQKFTASIGKLKGLLRSPWGAAAVAALAAFAGGVFGAWRNSEKFRHSLSGLGRALRSLWATVAASLGPIWGQIKTTFSASGNEADSAGIKLKHFGDALSGLVSKVTTGIGWIRDNWTPIAAGLVLFFQLWANTIAGVLSAALSGLWSLLKFVFGMVSGLVGAVWNAVTTFFQWAGLADATSTALGGTAIAGGVLGKVIVYLGTAFATVGKILIAVMKLVPLMANAFIGLTEILGSIAKAIWKLFTGDFSGAWQALSKGFSGAWAKIWGSVKGAAGAFKDAFDLSGTLGDVTRRFNDIFKDIQAGSPSKPRRTPPRPGGRLPGNPSDPGDDDGDDGGGGSGNGRGKGRKSRRDREAERRRREAEKRKRAAEAAKQRLQRAKEILTGALKDFWGSLTGSASQINTATRKLERSVQAAFDKVGKHAKGQRLVSYLEGVNKRLQKLAKERDRINKAIEENQSFRAEVRDSALDSAKFANLPYSTTTAAGIAEGLKQRLSKIRRFVTVIKALAKKGLAKSLLREVVEAGPIEGLALGETLLNADKATFAAINKAQRDIEKSAKILGNTAGDMIFGSLAALKKKGKGLQDQMDKIARDAIRKVAKTFGLGYKDIQRITGQGMEGINKVLYSKLGSTKSSIASATAGIKNSWSGMIKGMNKATGELVNVTYTRGVKGTVDAMAKIGGTKSPAPSLRFSAGGTVPGYAPRWDVVPALLTPGEGVMVPELARQVGPGRLHEWNRVARAGGNVFAGGGIVSGWDWVNEHQNDPYTGYDAALSGAIGAVVEPALRSAAKLAGKFSATEAEDARRQYPSLHRWTKLLDKKAAEGGNATAVIKAARAEKQAGHGRSYYNGLAGMSDAPWCAMFISHIVKMAKATKAYWSSGMWPAVATWRGAARSTGRFLPSSQAQPGDLAIYRGTGHINLVVKNLGGGRLYTIGGNQGGYPGSITEGVRTGMDGVARPALPKRGGDFVNPWPGSLRDTPDDSHLGGGIDLRPLGLLPNYQRGAWELARDQIAKVHRGEMVVPARPAMAIRRSLANPRRDGGVTYQITINAAPDVPTERTVMRALSYAHTMYGR